jgi:hypothetical protein
MLARRLSLLRLAELLALVLVLLAVLDQASGPVSWEA